MKTISNTARRQFLRGAGGFTLALPFLPSIEPRAFGQVAPSGNRYFMALGSPHGGANVANMYPAPATLTTKYDIYPGHTVSYGPLQRTVNGSQASLSPILSASATALTDRLVAKMNVLQGFGYAFNIVHHSGGYLGNFAANTGQDDDAKAVQAFPFPTIDQVMAWSPSFYPNQAAGIKERAMLHVYGNYIDDYSYNYSNPAAKTGTIASVRTVSTVGELFDSIFVKAAPPSNAPPPRKPIVDQVIENYRSLRDGNRRLSAGDRQRLEDHMARLTELQRRVSVVTAPPASCADFKKPSAPQNTYKQELQNYTDVVAAGFICGSSRIAATQAENMFYVGSPYYPGDRNSFHANVAHNFKSPAGQATIVAGFQDLFENVFLALAAKLDVDDGTGSTYLDNALLMWTQECGAGTHESTGIPIITFGGAGKFLNTGFYADFRNQTAKTQFQLQGALDYSGLTYNRWLSIALQAMGIPRAEFERNGAQGYSHPWVGPSHASQFVPGVVANASDVPRPLKV